MSKLSIIQKEKKKFFLFNKYYLKHKTIKNKFKDLKNNKIILNDFISVSHYLKNIPRNSSGIRIRNRCFITGRPRGVFRRFGVSRMVARVLSWKGYMPGLLKSCW